MTSPLNSKGTYTKTVSESGYIILIPLLNDIRLDLYGFKWKIEVKQLFIYYLTAGTEIKIDGLDCDEFSYFFSLFLHQEYNQIQKTLLPIDLKKENILKKIIPHDLFNLYIGNVFFDDKEGHQIATIIGSIEKGFSINATIIISTENIEEFKDEFMGGPGGRPEGMKGDFPPGGMPPMQTKFNFKTDQPAKIVIKVFNPKGDLIKTVIDQNYQIGVFEIDFTKFGLPRGPYHYTLEKIVNSNTSTESYRFFIQ